MKTKQLFIAIIFLLGLSAMAQQAPFMVCNADGSTCTPYTTLGEAYSAAAAGSYIYMPAGDFSFGSARINKQIHLVGIGYNTNASLATGITRISGDIIFNTGCDGSSFEGFYLTGAFLNEYCHPNGITFNHVNFDRLSYTYYANFYWLNCTINNCVVRNYVEFGYSSTVFGDNLLVMNSYVKSFYTMNHSTIKNCVIGQYDSNPWCFTDIHNTTVKNCVIGGEGLYNNASNTSDNVTFLNNITTVASGSLTNGKPSCTEMNNSYNQAYTDIFETATTVNYDETKDYHIKATSPAHLSGTDGTDIGVYGGASPWKVVPNYPHITAKIVNPTTDASGNLPVHITVTTQN